MMQKAILISFLLIPFLNINCSLLTDYNQWLLEWQFKNITDTTASIKSPSHEFTVQSNIVSNVSVDSLKSDGHFIACIEIDGDHKMVDEFPKASKIHIKLFYDTIVAFDSLFAIEELDFKVGFSSIYNSNQMHV